MRNGTIMSSWLRLHPHGRLDPAFWIEVQDELTRRGYVEKINQSSVTIKVTETKLLFGEWRAVSGVSRAWRVSPSLLTRVEDGGGK
jgi:hypothetical protein